MQETAGRKEAVREREGGMRKEQETTSWRAGCGVTAKPQQRTWVGGSALPAQTGEVEVSGGMEGMGRNLHLCRPQKKPNGTAAIPQSSHELHGHPPLLSQIRRNWSAAHHPGCVMKGSPASG